MLSQKEVQNNWPEIRKRILNLWTKLNFKDVEETHGNINLLRRLVLKKYGLAENFSIKLEELCDAQLTGTFSEALARSTYHLKI